MPKLRIVTFDTALSYKRLETFDCGNAMIDQFVRRSLKKRVKKHFSQAYVLLDEKEHFLGFYTLDTFSIHRELFELDRPSSLPPVVPVIKLGMLGVDHSVQGLGIGKRLLRDALLRVVEISHIAGCAGVYLLAEEKAIGFYEKLGFVILKQAYPAPMFLHIDKIIKST